MIVCESLKSVSQSVVQAELKRLLKFSYVDNIGNNLVGMDAYGPIAMLKIQKEQWTLERC